MTSSNATSAPQEKQFNDTEISIHTDRKDGAVQSHRIVVNKGVKS